MTDILLGAWFMANMLLSLGERTYSFSFVVSIISTVIALALSTAGVDPSVYNIPIIMGMKPFYQTVYSIYQSLPHGTSVTGLQLLEIIALTLSGAFVQFIFTLLASFFLLVNSLAMVVPPQLGFLIPPLYFVSALLQASAWIYIGYCIKNNISGLWIFSK